MPHTFPRKKGEITLNRKTTTRNFLKAAGVMSVAAMCPYIIAFGLGMSQMGTAADGNAVYKTVETAEIEDTGGALAAVPDSPGDTEYAGQAWIAEDMGQADGMDNADSADGTEAEGTSARERAELIAKAKHLSDYGKEANPDYRQIGYVYTEEMYYKLTGATELPDDWTDQMGPLMRGIIKEEDSFVETLQTDDGDAQEQWQPESSVDGAMYQMMAVNDAPVAPGALGAVQAAQKRLGYPYSQARRDSGIAYDCSSLVYWSYIEAGVNIDPAGGHTAASIAQYLESTGKGVSGGDLRPGDLIFYSYKRNGRYKNISHVAMVAGDGMIVHASSSKGMVVMSGLTLNKAVAIARPTMGMEWQVMQDESDDGIQSQDQEFSQDMQENYGPGMQEVPEAAENQEEPQDQQSQVIEQGQGMQEIHEGQTEAVQESVPEEITVMAVPGIQPAVYHGVLEGDSMAYTL